MKRTWFSVVAVLLLLLAPVAAQAKDSTIALTGGPGAAQIYLRIDDVVVTADGSVTKAHKANGRAVTIANASVGELYRVGRYVISYSYFQDKGRHYWFSYNVDTNKIKYKVIPTTRSPFWGDDNGLYYADYASTPNIFRYDPKIGKTTKILSSVVGQPRGFVDDRLICMDFRNDRIISYDGEKNMEVLFTGTSILDAQIVNQKIYVSRGDGLFRLDNGKLKRLYDQYAPIIAVVEPYFINATSDSEDGTLTNGTMRFYLNDAKNNRYALIGSLKAGPNSGYLMSPGLSEDGAFMAFNRYNPALPFYEFRMPYSNNMRAYG